MARFPNGRNFRHKRPRKPDSDKVVFELLRLMRGRTNARIARQTYVAPSTISKLRTRRTRYPTHITVVGILKALGLRYAVVDDDGVEVGSRYDSREARPHVH